MSRSISSMIDDVRSQTAEVRSAVQRLRNANRRMVGGTGEAPTPLSTGGGQKVQLEPADRLPLLEDLSVELERLNGATSDLRAELAFLENFTETADNVKTEGYAVANR